MLEQKCMKAWISNSNKKNNCRKEPHICASNRNHWESWLDLIYANQKSAYYLRIENMNRDHISCFLIIYSIYEAHKTVYRNSCIRGKAELHTHGASTAQPLLQTHMCLTPPSLFTVFKNNYINVNMMKEDSSFKTAWINIKTQCKHYQKFLLHHNCKGKC